MRLRQVAFVAENLMQVREELFQLLGLSEDYADPGVGEFGLENSVMTIGDTFLEVVSPTQTGTTAGRLLERRGGDGGYMVLVQTDDIEFMRNHTESLNVRKIWELDSDDTKAFHLHPKDIGGAILSVDQMEPPESWRWAGKAGNQGRPCGSQRFDLFLYRLTTLKTWRNVGARYWMRQYSHSTVVGLCC